MAISWIFPLLAQMQEDSDRERQSAKHRVAVLGGGESGTGAALLAEKLGYWPIVSDAGPIKEENKDRLEEAGVAFEEEGHDKEAILNAHEIVKSPGIDPKHEIIQAALAKGIPVIDELELASRAMNGAKAICITGANGKTTTTLLTYHLLKEAGYSVGLAGNVGHSLAGQLAAGAAHDWWVIEVSSFQLDGMPTFRPHIAMLLNITPDHLDRYGSMQAYAESKYGVARSQTADDHLVYFWDNEWVTQGLLERALLPQHHAFGLEKYPILSAWIEGTESGGDAQLQVRCLGDSFSIRLAEQPLKGPHNQLNIAAAALAARLAGLSASQIGSGLKTFRNAPHRLEVIGEINGVTFINDSKATNPDSVKYALMAMQTPVVWVAGGKDKGNDYGLIAGLVREKVRHLICLTKYPEPLKSAFGSQFEQIPVTQSVEECIQIALELARPGDTVLLSPACASFDLFKNYEDRGNQFRDAVLAVAAMQANR